MVEASEEIYSSLHRRFKGDLLRSGQSGYEDARAIWNGMVARKPGLIARCADVSDVQNAIRAAAESVPVSRPMTRCCSLRSSRVFGPRAI